MDIIDSGLLTRDDIRRQLRAQLPEVIGGLRTKARERGVQNAPSREAGYSIVNNADEAVLRIYDEIWWLGVNAQDLAADLDQITAPRIRVEINSPGGDVWDGVAIYNALRAHPAHVTTRVDGIAASIASVIAQAGDTRIMLGGSQMMIHNAWGMTIGDHSDHEDMAEVLAHQDGIIAGIYAQRSGQPKEQFLELMEAETWLTAEEAVDAGLADEIIEPGPKDKVPTLHDKIAFAVSAAQEAVSSAEQVSAVRAEAGKTLSQVNLDSLNGLRETLVRILALAIPQVDPETEAKRAAARMRDVAWRVTVPPHLL